MDELIGKWVQAEGQPYQGLWFEFNQDGTFTAEYEPMGIVSSGTFETGGNEIVIQQTAHTLGFIGEFKGIYAIKENNLIMALAASPGGAAPEDFSEARTYIKTVKK